MPREGSVRETVLRWRQEPPVWLVLSLGLLVLAGLSVVDFYSGTELNLSIFYAGPLLYVGWFAGRWSGVPFAAATSAAWGLSDIAAGMRYSAPVIPVWNGLARFAFFVIVIYVLGELRHSRSDALLMARTDQLTGLYNSRALSEEIRQEMGRQRRYGHPFALAYIDLDHFKSVNDSLGHSAGDELLANLADALRVAVRDTDVVARIGGDEFVVVMPETDADAAHGALERIKTAIDSAVESISRWVPGVGATVGAVVYLSPPESPDAAIRAADDVMYSGKHNGRNVVKLAVHDR